MFLNDRKTDFVIILLFIALAALIRAPGLGKWCVNSDEYLLSRSIAYIQDHGIPKFPSGGYYVRGILYQYLIAIPVGIFRDREFSLRLFPLIFGILTIPIVYLFCRKMMPAFSASICSIILVLSSWHIEFSRFARFYSAFQFLFFLFLYYLYSGIQNENKKHRSLAIAVAFIAIFVLEASIFLPFILLITYLFNEYQDNNKSLVNFIFIFVFLIAINYLANAVDFRNIGVMNALPPDLLSRHPNSFLKDLPVHLPSKVLIKYVLNSNILVSIYGFLFCMGMYQIYYLLREVKSKRDSWTIFFIISIAVLPIFHLFMLLGFILIILLVNRTVLIDFYKNHLISINIYIISMFIFWIFVIVYSGNANKLMHYLVGYPLFKQYIIVPYYKSIPVWALGAAAIIIISTLRIIFARKNDANRFILTILLSCILLIGIFKQPENTTRYSFFFFPLIIVLWCLESWSLSNWYMAKKDINKYRTVSVLMTSIPFIFFIFTEEFNLSHIRNVSASNFNFRVGKYEKFQEHWYERYDYETPAFFINEHYKQGDAVVVDSNPFGDYIRTPYYFYSPYSTHWFRQFSRNFGKEELWSGKPMLHDLRSIEQIVPTDKVHNLWLVSKNQIAGGTYVADFAKNHDLYLRLEYVGIDDRFKVWKLNRR